MFGRRDFIRNSVITFAFGLTCTAAMADNYPSKAIRLILPFAPGGVTDVAGRVIADRLSTKLGQSVIVENRGGGGGRIGADLVAKSTPDGYVLVFGNSSPFSSSPATSKDMPYDVLKDFTPIAAVFTYQSVLVCHPSLPVKTTQELVEYARKNPGKVTHGSAGPASGNHFMGELFNSLAGSGVRLEHVPYRGSSQAILDTAIGNISCTFDGAPKQYIDSGKVRPIAVTGLQRDPRFPNVPTLDESGLKGYEIFTWQGILGPKGLPDAVVQKLNQAINEILAEPALKERAIAMGLTPVGGKPETMGKILRDDLARYRKIAKEANIILD